MDAATAPRLEDWLPAAHVLTHHRRSAAVTPERLWAAARGVRLQDTHALGHLVRWRIPGLEPHETFHAMFRAYPFALLEEGDTYALSGLCGRIWTLARDYPRLEGPDDFRAWADPGTVRVLFGHWVQPGADGRAELVSETRVEPVDRSAGRRLRALWVVLGGFERLVGAEALTVAANAAERR